MTNDVETGNEAVLDTVVTLEYEVTQGYIRDFELKTLIEYYETRFHDEVNKTLPLTDILDYIYDRIERGGWKAEEFLAEMAEDRYWLQTKDAEITDLRQAASRV